MGLVNQFSVTKPIQNTISFSSTICPRPPPTNVPPSHPHLNRHSVYNISHAGGVICAVAVNAAGLLQVVVQLSVLRRPRPTPSPTVASLLSALKNQRQDLRGGDVMTDHDMLHFRRRTHYKLRWISHIPLVSSLISIYVIIFICHYANQFLAGKPTTKYSPSVCCEKLSSKLCTKWRGPQSS